MTRGSFWTLLEYIGSMKRVVYVVSMGVLLLILERVSGYKRTYIESDDRSRILLWTGVSSGKHVSWYHSSVYCHPVTCWLHHEPSVQHLQTHLKIKRQIVMSASQTPVVFLNIAITMIASVTMHLAGKFVILPPNDVVLNIMFDFFPVNWNFK